MIVFSVERTYNGLNFIHKLVTKNEKRYIKSLFSCFMCSIRTLYVTFTSMFCYDLRYMKVLVLYCTVKSHLFLLV